MEWALAFLCTPNPNSIKHVNFDKYPCFPFWLPLHICHSVGADRHRNIRNRTSFGKSLILDIGKMQARSLFVVCLVLAVALVSARPSTKQGGGHSHRSGQGGHGGRGQGGHGGRGGHGGANGQQGGQRGSQSSQSSDSYSSPCTKRGGCGGSHSSRGPVDIHRVIEEILNMLNMGSSGEGSGSGDVQVQQLVEALAPFTDSGSRADELPTKDELEQLLDNLGSGDAENIIARFDELTPEQIIRKLECFIHHYVVEELIGYILDMVYEGMGSGFGSGSGSGSGSGEYYIPSLGDIIAYLEDIGSGGMPVDWYLTEVLPIDISQEELAKWQNLSPLKVLKKIAQTIHREFIKQLGLGPNQNTKLTELLTNLEKRVVDLQQQFPTATRKEIHGFLRTFLKRK